MGDTELLIKMGNRISKRRKELNMTQEQVAEIMNISIQSLSCIELGKKAIRPENLCNLCQALNISADYILMGKKTSTELEGVLKNISLLNEADFKMVECLIEHLKSR